MNRCILLCATLVNISFFTSAMEAPTIGTQAFTTLDKSTGTLYFQNETFAPQKITYIKNNVQKTEDIPAISKLVMLGKIKDIGSKITINDLTTDWTLMNAQPSLKPVTQVPIGYDLLLSLAGSTIEPIWVAPAERDEPLLIIRSIPRDFEKELAEEMAVIREEEAAEEAALAERERD